MMRCAGHLAQMWEMRNVYETVVENMKLKHE
jgi:hypothetical protein